MIARIARAALLVLLLLALVPAGLFLHASLFPPVSTLMLGRWLAGRPVERAPVPLAAISPRLVRAVVASEDARLCEHRGVDLVELRAALDEADEDGPARGASTIPMQAAKNLLLWPGRSYLRKALEAPLALLLTAAWGRRGVLERYLNVAEWGEGVFGAEAAARRHFGKSAADLGAWEAALLAAALPNPLARDAGRPSPALRRLAARRAARAAALPASALACLAP